MTMMVTGSTISRPPINDWRTKLFTAPRLISLLSSGVEVIPDPVYQPCLSPSGRLHIHVVINLLFQQGARQWRINTDPALLGIGLVRADQAVRDHLALLVLQLDPGTKEHPAGVLRRPVHHYHVIQPARQEADAAVDFTQHFLAVDILCVLRAIALGRRFLDRLDRKSTRLNSSHVK